MKTALVILLALLGGCARRTESAEAGRRASVYPDFDGATIPPNIAPFNLKVLEKGQRFEARISGAAGEPIELSSASGSFAIPPDAWQRLLKANAGGEVRTDLYAKTGSGWQHFETLRNPVAPEEIDPYLVYRYIPPIYDKWGRISIRQRDLRGFDERVLFDNGSAGSVCVNCHTFLNHRTAEMLIHARPTRPGQIPAMILVRGGRAEKIDTRIGGRGAASYPAFHPGGKLVAFSRNSLLQIFHATGAEAREVVDRDSDLGLYDIDSGKTFTAPPISRTDRMETWPTWSPDGRYLYFSSAAQTSANRQSPPPNWDTIRYDLDRVSYDAATGRWGDVETVVAAAQIGRSISEPVVSPDGRFLMFTGHDHGSFPIFQPSADLYLVDLGSRAVRRIDELDSERADSYHSWSSNGRWVIFSSKREDGVFTRLYIAHAEPGGHFGKPFVLPQRDPEFYRSCAMLFNRPELIAEPVGVTDVELTRAINSTAGTGEAVRAADEPYQGSK
jgi:hypothetical protein